MRKVTSWEGEAPVPFTDKFSPAPREVRIAGAITALPGLTMVVLAVLLLVKSGESTGNNLLAEVGYYAVIGAGTIACGIGLLMGKTWARSPAAVVALIMVGVGWYLAGPSGHPGPGVPIALLGAFVLVLLFRRASRAWVLGLRDGETEEEAAERGGAAGRAARRDED